MIFFQLNAWRRSRIGILVLSLVFLSGCEHHSQERSGATPPNVVTTEDVYEVIAPPPPLDSRYNVYIPTQVIIKDQSIVRATSGDGFILRFSWDFTPAPKATLRSYLADWTVIGAEEGDSNDGNLEEKFFFQKQKREFVTYKKLEAGKVYVFKVIAHVTVETENQDLFMSEVVLKKIRVDLQAL